LPKPVKREAKIKGIENMNRVCVFVLSTSLLLGRAPRAIAQNTPAPADSRAAENLPNDAKSLTEVNKELSNPISSICAIAFQEKYLLAEQARTEQHQFPVPTRASGLLDRKLESDHSAGSAAVKFQFIPESEWKPAPGNRLRRHGSGLDAVPTDSLVGNWLIAAGPTFIFPTATNT
jgi:hypothetical protein